MPNHLQGETSPYLLQHADNPVDWYPWGEEALERARREDKPILLSIGYSACHWCHVMAHESFEDEATARVMNELFINIKVDREERPDLDKIYQTAHYILTQRPGGWPLTMFLTPDQVPFFGGTYFPKEARYGLPAFRDLLRRIAAFYREHRSDIERQNREVLAILQSTVPEGAPGAQLDATPLEGALRELAQAYDARHGGFGSAPKFPHPTSLAFLLHHPEGRSMAMETLRKMANGGIRDHLGGGFYRYAVDEGWMIPHFEKMLYDNAQLLPLYAQAFALTGDPLFRGVAEEMADWTLREMQSSEGGFYSALDADSEGKEGKFYTWTRAEVQALLEPELYQVFALRYGLDLPPNFEGTWHLFIARSLEDVAEQAGMPGERVASLLEKARHKLLEAREKRVHPGKDDKVLTAWNALMIRGLSEAGLLLARPPWIEAARKALDFIKAKLFREGRLLSAYREGKAHIPAYLDDHAFLIDAILTFAQAEWRGEDLALAQNLAEQLLERFADREKGGFFFTAADHEALILRPKPFSDDATPSGNAVAALALSRLGHLLGEGRYIDAAERTLRAAWEAIRQAPQAHAAFLPALEEALSPPTLVILRGEQAAMAPWQRRAFSAFAPHRMTFPIPARENLPPALQEKKAPATGVAAYLCQGTACQPPIFDQAAFGKAMEASEVHG
ncbi:MAG: thioredoxin domain-containing protein [Gammaproteobacteria bacterium]|nr:MAG: thioredoxin domain-containing protein [Gammaproteobacteria bacterium]